jgi:hypothetical protein
VLCECQSRNSWGMSPVVYLTVGVEWQNVGQGGGYYGVSFFTTDLSWEKLILVLLDEPGLMMSSGGDSQLSELPARYRCLHYLI